MAGSPTFSDIESRIVQIVGKGSCDERGGCDMARLAPQYKLAFGSQLDSTKYGYAKLSMLVASMDEVVVDYCGPGTSSVVRLKGEAFTPRKRKAQTSNATGKQPKPIKQPAACASAPSSVSLGEVKARIVELVRCGKEVQKQYGYSKLGLMIADMCDVLTVDHTHKTNKIVRLVGAPSANAPSHAPKAIKRAKASRGQAAALPPQPHHSQELQREPERQAQQTPQDRSLDVRVPRSDEVEVQKAKERLTRNQSRVTRTSDPRLAAKDKPTVSSTAGNQEAVATDSGVTPPGFLVDVTSATSMDMFKMQRVMVIAREALLDVAELQW
eukprot:COSAG02_NODE_16227_length_1102_cov_0.616152_1_plen_325_part_10